MDLNIRSPLMEDQLTKAEVRALLRTWTSELGPAEQYCLATRVPHDVRISSTILRRVERAEARPCSVQIQEPAGPGPRVWARVEVAPEDIPRLFQEREKVVQSLKKLGYRKVALTWKGTAP